MRKTTDALADRIREYLTRKEISFGFHHNGDGVFSFRIGLEGKMRASTFEIYLSPRGYTLRCRYPLGADPESPQSMARMAEYVSRCSCGMRNGTFEFDYSDGEVAFRLFHNCMDGLPSDDVLHYSLSLASTMMDRYAEGLLETLYTDRPVEQIAQDAEHARAGASLAAGAEPFDGAARGRTGAAAGRGFETSAAVADTDLGKRHRKRG